MASSVSPWRAIASLVSGWNLNAISYRRRALRVLRQRPFAFRPYLQRFFAIVLVPSGRRLVVRLPLLVDELVLRTRPRHPLLHSLFESSIHAAGLLESDVELLRAGGHGESGAVLERGGLSASIRADDGTARVL